MKTFKTLPIWQCACCGNDEDPLFIRDGAVTCDECAEFDDRFDAETYEEEKRRRIAEANEY